MSVKEANHSRIVTKVRWVIESVNGQIRQCRYFSQTIQNSSIAFVGGYLNIICAIINAFKKTSNLSTESGSEWAAQILTLRDKQNRLLHRLERMNHNAKNPHWKKYDARMINFPILNEEDVRNICFGNYQIKQAQSYITEHMQPSILDEEQFEFVVELCSQYDDLVRIRFASRYSNTRKYVATVHFDNDDDDKPIKRWFCTRAAGARIIGCCTHVTALIWHLGVSRAEIYSSDDPLAAKNFLQHVDDCSQYSKKETSGDENDGSSQSDVSDE